MKVTKMRSKVPGTTSGTVEETPEYSDSRHNFVSTKLRYVYDSFMMLVMLL